MIKFLSDILTKTTYMLCVIKTINYLYSLFIRLKNPSMKVRTKLKMKITLTLFLIFNFLIIYNLHSQWTQTGGPYGGFTERIVQSNDYIIISAGNAGLFRSSNHGENWSRCTEGLPEEVSILDIQVYDNKLYTSKYGGGIYISEDQGATWNSINSEIAPRTFSKLKVKGDTICAAFSGGGIFCSFDKGSTWENKSTNISDIEFRDFAFFNSKIYAGGTKLYESSDKGDTWNEVVIPDLKSIGVRCMLAENGYLHIGDDGFFHTTTNGNDWVRSSIDFSGTITSMGTIGTKIFLTTRNGRIYISEDHGESWDLIENTKVNGFAQGALFLEDRILMTTREGGVFKTTDNGLTWTESNTGLSALQITAFGKNSNYLFAGTERQGVYRSNDLGESWEKVNTGLSSYNSFSIRCFINVADTVFIGTGGSLYKSVDNGETWIEKYNPGINQSTVTIDYYNGFFAVAVNGEGVYASTDEEIWDLTGTNGLNTQTSYYDLEIVGDSLFVSTHSGEIFFSDDKGVNWTDISTGGDFTLTKKLEFKNDTLLAATTKGVLLSTDLGSNWSNLNPGGNAIINDFVFDNQKIYVASISGISVYDKTEKYWYQPEFNLLDKYVTKLIFHDDLLFAGTYSGTYSESSTSQVWKCTKTALNDNQNSFFESKKDILPWKIFPNPTDGRFTIECGQNKFQNLMVSDLTGKTLFEKTNVLDKVEIDLSAYENGIYFISVKIDNIMFTSKIVKN